MNHFYTHFNDILDQISNGHSILEESKNKTFKLPNYPHSNVYMTKDTNELHMEFALAGYSQEKVSVSAGGNTITVSADPDERVSSYEDISIHEGISRRKVNFTMNVDEAYEAKKAKVRFVGGILSIMIPKSKESESIKLM